MGVAKFGNDELRDWCVDELLNSGNSASFGVAWTSEPLVTRHSAEWRNELPELALPSFTEKQFNDIEELQNIINITQPVLWYETVK